jgi:hypothetical protein
VWHGASFEEAKAGIPGGIFCVEWNGQGHHRLSSRTAKHLPSDPLVLGGPAVEATGGSFLQAKGCWVFWCTLTSVL